MAWSRDALEDARPGVTFYSLLVLFGFLSLLVGFLAATCLLCLSVCLLLLGWPEVRSGAWATPNLLRTEENDTTDCQYRLLSSLSFSIRQGAHL